MSLATQREAVSDLEEDGKKILLRPKPGRPDFVSGAEGSSGSDIQTYGLLRSYATSKIDGKNILDRDSRLMIASGSVEQEPGPGWSVFIESNPDRTRDADFPVPDAAGVKEYEVVKIDHVSYEDDFPILTYLQVRA